VRIEVLNIGSNFGSKEYAFIFIFFDLLLFLFSLLLFALLLFDDYLFI
jgi:hypothetical protein